MIYFFEADGLGLVKIGFTDQPIEKRLRQLACISPVRLRCLGTMEGDLATEGALHLRFDDLWDHAEWYRLAPELAQFIRQHTTPFAPRDPNQAGRRIGDPCRLAFTCSNGFGRWMLTYAEDRGLHVGCLIHEGMKLSAERLGVPGPPEPSGRWFIHRSYAPIVNVGTLTLLCESGWKRWLVEHARSRGMKTGPMAREAIRLSAEDVRYPVPAPTARR